MAAFTLQENVFQIRFFIFCSYVTQHVLFHDSVNSTNHTESDLLDSDLGHFYGPKSDSGHVLQSEQ